MQDVPVSPALLAASAITVFAGERPRDTGIAACAASVRIAMFPMRNRREPPGGRLAQAAALPSWRTSRRRWRRQR
ncbi:hypothetical protein ACTMU2_06155 [Cupriavidus basilensis]